MESLPLVSIAAINYNNAKYVIDTLESIKYQSYENIELLIIDDCSTDESIIIIKEWLKGYNKPFKLLLHEKNMGPCYGCNNALKNAKGKYISIIATDDIMMPDKIKIQVPILEQSDGNVCSVYSDALLIKEDGSPRYGQFIQRIRDFEELPSGDIYDELIIRGNFIPGMSVLCKTDCLKKVGWFDEELPYEDYDMWLRLAKDYHFLFSTYVSVKYRVRKNSLTYTIKNWDIASVKIYMKHLESFPKIADAIEQIARRAFYKRDENIINELRNFKGKSTLIDKVIFYSKFKLPNFLLYRVKLD